MSRLLPVALALLVAAPAVRGQAPDRNPLPPAEARAAPLKLPDRPKVPAAVRADEPRAEPKTGFVVERPSVATEQKSDGAVERVPALVVRPPLDKGRPGSPAGGDRPVRDRRHP